MVITPLAIRTPIRADFPNVMSMNNSRGSYADEFLRVVREQIRGVDQSSSTRSSIKIGVVWPIKPNKVKQDDENILNQWIQELNQAANYGSPLQFHSAEGIFIAPNITRAGQSFWGGDERRYTPSIAFATQKFQEQVEQGTFYVLADDLYDKGGTFAALYHVITQHGGFVLAAAAEQVGGAYAGCMGGMGFFARNSVQVEIFSNIITDNGTITEAGIIADRKAKIDVILERNFLSINTLTGDELSAFIYGSVGKNFDKFFDKIDCLIPERKVAFRPNNLLGSVRQDLLSQASLKIFE